MAPERRKKAPEERHVYSVLGDYRLHVTVAFADLDLARLILNGLGKLNVEHAIFKISADIILIDWMRQLNRSIKLAA